MVAPTHTHTHTIAHYPGPKHFLLFLLHTFYCQLLYRETERLFVHREQDGVCIYLSILSLACTALSIGYCNTHIPPWGLIPFPVLTFPLKEEDCGEHKGITRLLRLDILLWLDLYAVVFVCVCVLIPVFHLWGFCGCLQRSHTYLGLFSQWRPD